jgi:hypothetical protein
MKKSLCGRRGLSAYQCLIGLYVTIGYLDDVARVTQSGGEQPIRVRFKGVDISLTDWVMTGKDQGISVNNAGGYFPEKSYSITFGALDLYFQACERLAADKLQYRFYFALNRSQSGHSCGLSHVLQHADYRLYCVSLMFGILCQRNRLAQIDHQSVPMMLLGLLHLSPKEDDARDSYCERSPAAKCRQPFPITVFLLGIARYVPQGRASRDSGYEKYGEQHECRNPARHERELFGFLHFANPFTHLNSEVVA